MIQNGLSILSEKREETILVYGSQETSTIESLLVQAKEAGKRFTLLVVDSAPDYRGRAMAKRLSAAGIKVKYTLIQMLAAIIQTVTKVLLAATYVLCDGSLVSPMGSSMIACIANKNHIPVIAVAESYKFVDRVNLD